MSAVDPKPTYTLKTEIYLVSLALSCRIAAVRKELLKMAGMPLNATERLDIMDKIHAKHLVDYIENDIEDGKEISLVELLIGRKEDQIREGLDNTGVQCIARAFVEWSSNCDTVYTGSRAAFIVMEDLVIAETYINMEMKDRFSKAADLAVGLTHASACALKMHPEATYAVITNMYREFVLRCGEVVHIREVAEDISFHTVSRRVRRAYAFAMSRRSFKAKDQVFQDGVSTKRFKERLSGAIRRNEDHISGIEYFFMGPVRAIKRGGELYIVDQDNIHKVYHTFHRRMMAVFSAHMSEISSACSYSAKITKDFFDTLIKAASDLAKKGRPIS
ncbi:hypothetical protein EV44_g3366 [Erysiphe necator]|uniref:Uncharacterized protein n=1 Tax=Uncinula necator TaxID=52586 RepID=A0A0B1PDE3_UNCNE|nr:hypothetical protein EV44_g3366 [Erysiphe necator]